MRALHRAVRGWAGRGPKALALGAIAAMRIPELIGPFLRLAAAEVEESVKAPNWGDAPSFQARKTEATDATVQDEPKREETPTAGAGSETVALGAETDIETDDTILAALGAPDFASMTIAQWLLAGRSDSHDRLHLNTSKPCSDRGPAL